MTGLWLAGLIRHRAGRLLGTALGISLAVALIATLGVFLSTSQATMTSRAVASVAVDWQVQVQRGADPATVETLIRTADGTGSLAAVHLGESTGLKATTGSTTQSTGAAVVLGLPPGYATTFPGQVRQLAGAADGPQLAQQTAANLHVRPGDQVLIGRPGSSPAPVTIAGVVDLPQADTLFQKVGAPPQAQPSAPPDNVILLPETTFTAVYPAGAGVEVSTQFHLARTGPLPTDPAGASEAVLGAAHNLEAKAAGTALVGDNLGAALAAARSDAAYAQMLFLFLGLPGAVLAAFLTAAAAGAGAGRRRGEQTLLRTRGLSEAAVLRLAAGEAAVVAGLGCVLGLLIAWGGSRFLLSSDLHDVPAAVAAGWGGAAVLLAFAVAGATIAAPTVRDLRVRTVTAASGSVRGSRLPWWLRTGVDLILLAAAAAVFWASSSNGYTLVLAPEGVATVSVSYWAFLGPALLWLGAAGLLARITLLTLAHGRRPLAAALRPLTGRLAGSGAASLSRQRPGLARAVVLLALSLSFAASTATFNATYQQQAEADAQLTNGADVTVTQPASAQVPPSAGAALTHVPGVRRVEPVQHRFAYVGADLQDLFGVQPGSIASVTALQDSYFTGGTAAQLMAQLTAHPDSVLVSAETVKDFQLSPGDLINLRLQDGATKTLKSVPFHFAGVVSEFPTAPKDSFFVANADYVTRATGSDAVGAFLIDTGGTDQPQVAAAVRAQLGPGAVVTDLTQTRGRVGSSLTSVNLAGLTRLELTFAVLLAVAAGGLVLALSLTERRRTLAIMALLGAARSQLRGLVVGEGLLITLGGLLGGAVIGTALTRMLVTVLTGVFDPPPSAIAVPWAYLSVTAAAVVAALLGAAALGARATTRPAVEELREL